MATESGPAGRDSGAELAAAVHQVLAILTDLSSDARPLKLTERVALVRWPRQELGAVDALLISVSARRDTRTAPIHSAAAR